jgi:anti-sigma regulatory factor (Ser/Thr protein kinase)
LNGGSASEWVRGAGVLGYGLLGRVPPPNRGFRWRLQDGTLPMATTEHWSHEVELTAKEVSVPAARAFITQNLLRQRCPADLVEDVQLVVSELATNALVHGEAGFAVKLRVLDDMVVVEVEDGSHRGPVRRAPADLDTNGRGVAIVEALSNKWGVKRYAGGGKAVWAEFVREPRGPQE